MDGRIVGRAVVLSLVLVLAACGDDDARVDVDAGQLDAGGALDAGARDSGIDGGAIDAGEADAGSTDAGELDAGDVDAGEPDADTSDAGGDAGARLCAAGGGACDVALQDCPSDHACYYAEVSGVAATRCELVFVPGTDGDPCEFADECAPGLTCRAGTCRQYCCPGAALDCPSGQACVQLAEAPNIGHCAPADACTLAPNAGCAAGRACYPGPAPETVGCFVAGTTPEGGACVANNACAPGTICLGAGPFSCLRVCRTAMGDADCTNPAHDCIAVPGYLSAQYGVCDVPSE
ncbi:hypothetical protein DB32_001524 [Sandaracinus amylolyticus]|uniref:Uncharacterized protein n=1 Tax=Sandaracinus amylolyticus TaxID=927083 RepID=A0A0F6W0I7_9BACT|nr:hypothetical protein DB32_001524 [Sandaracinus amylolyticus]